MSQPFSNRAPDSLHPAPIDPRELVLSRIMEAPPERVFEVWTRQFTRWWGPHGMSTPVCEMDLRPGGIFRTVMRAPDGTEYPTKGIFLEVTPPARIVFTNAFGPGWIPDADIFFTADIAFEPLPGGKTHYIARALHWTQAQRDEHEAMGFHQGWGESIERLAALATRSATPRS